MQLCNRPVFLLDDLQRELDDLFAGDGRHAAPALQLGHLKGRALMQTLLEAGERQIGGNLGEVVSKAIGGLDPVEENHGPAAAGGFKQRGRSGGGAKVGGGGGRDQNDQIRSPSGFQRGRVLRVGRGVDDDDVAAVADGEPQIGSEGGGAHLRVTVDEGDIPASLLKGGGQEQRDRRLADAAFAVD